MVGGDHGGGVVARPSRSRRRARPGRGGWRRPPPTSGIAVGGQPEPGPDEALGAPLRVGQRDQRVQHGPPRVAGRAGAARRARDVRDHAALRRRLDGPRHLGDGLVGGGDDAPGRCPSPAPAEIVAAPEDRQHLPAGAGRARWPARCPARPGPMMRTPASRRPPRVPIPTQLRPASARPSASTSPVRRRRHARAGVDEVGGQVGQRSEHEPPLRSSAGAAPRGRARRRPHAVDPAARRRRACAVPTAPRAPARPPPRAAGTPRGAARGVRERVELDDQVQVGALLRRARRPDRSRRPARRPRGPAATPPPSRRWRHPVAQVGPEPEEGPGHASAGPGDAHARGAELLGHRRAQLADDDGHRVDARRRRRAASAARCSASASSRA